MSMIKFWLRSIGRKEVDGSMLTNLTQFHLLRRLALSSALLLPLFAQGVALLAQTCPAWTLVNRLPRYDYAMAHDSVRGVTVMYGGGNTSNSALSDTWEWDGRSWMLRAESGPPPATNAKMVFDSTRRVCVLLVNNETWQWDGSTWTRRSIAGPTPQRTGFGLAYDTAHDRIVLFGGRYVLSGQVYHPADTWVWDGALWQRVTREGPPGRAHHGMTFDAARGRVVMFAGGVIPVPGSNVPMFLNDTWEWDGVAWQQRDAIGPRPRWEHAMAYSVTRQRVVVFGGEFDGYDSASWEWNGAAWAMLPASGPASRAHHELVEDSGRGVMVSFGGYDGTTTLGDTVELQMAGETPRWAIHPTGGAPIPRQLACMTYDRARNVHVLFGGGDFYGRSIYHGDTWEWDGETWHLRAMSGPLPRAGASMAYDEHRGVTVLFGGRGAQGQLFDTWEWDGTSWLLRASSGPIGSMGAAMAYDAAREVCVLVSGEAAAGGLQSETWAWDGNTWTVLAVGGPAGRDSAAIAYDRQRQVIVLHGGRIFATLSDTWEWDGIQWYLRSPTSEFARLSHQMVYDEAVGAVVACYGVALQATYVGDLWLWNASAQVWEQPPSPIPAPAHRSAHNMTFDPVAGVSLLFGGDTGTERNDTWQLDLAAAPGILAQPLDTVAAVGSATSISVTASGSGPFLYQWHRDGLPLTDGGNISGANSPTLTIDPVSFTDAGEYDVEISNDCGSMICDSATLTIVPAGDATGDGHVTVDDLIAVILGWGACPTPPAACLGDVAPPGGDGSIDVDDLIAVILNWGA
jgi:hypothetical protein